MIDRGFDAELHELNDLIMKMGNFAQEAISKCVEALKNRDESLTVEIIKGDVEMDDLELAVDDKAITLIARIQPMATDLRFITTAMKIATDLERIGDLAVDIAQKNLELLSRPLLKPLIDTPKLALISQQMITKSLDSFVSRDGKSSLKIHELEKESDKLRNAISEELVDIMMKDGNTVGRAIPLLLIARFLERICDHAMNIAEDVVYMVEGRVVKHLHTN